MRIGTRVETQEGRMGTVAGKPKVNDDHFWSIAVKFDDGAEEIIPEHELTPVATVGAKAMKFGIEAHRAGWSALARNSAQDDNVSVVSARTIGGTEIVLRFVGNRYDYAGSYAVVAGKRRKIRNVSEAKRLLGTL